LTDSQVRRLPTPERGNKIHYDDAVAGFGCRVTAAGARSFIFNYVVKATGRERRYTIGQFPDWSTVLARQEARRLRQEVSRGGDPLGDIETAREAPTVADLIARFRQEHLPRKRPSTRAAYEIALNLHIAPALGHLKLADVSYADIDKLHRHVTHTIQPLKKGGKRGGPTVANRVVAIVSRMFSLAQRWHMHEGLNPAQHVERNAEIKRKRYLSGEELGRLTTALAAYPNQQTANVVRLLLLTGARRGEVLSARWADLDLTTGIWTKPGSTTKQKSDHVIPLSAPARQLLADIRDSQLRGNPKRPLGEYVFPNGQGHVREFKKSWASICKAAEIRGLRVHDLRHSFASQLASGGASLPLIGALLGHSNPSTTSRYAHLFTDPQRAAVEKIGAIVEAAGKEPPELLPFKPGRRR
jgi:integrase